MESRCVRQCIIVAGTPDRAEEINDLTLRGMIQLQRVGMITIYGIGMVIVKGWNGFENRGTWHAPETIRYLNPSP